MEMAWAGASRTGKGLWVRAGSGGLCGRVRYVSVVFVGSGFRLARGFVSPTRDGLVGLRMHFWHLVHEDVALSLQAN